MSRMTCWLTLGALSLLSCSASAGHNKPVTEAKPEATVSRDAVSDEVREIMWGMARNAETINMILRRPGWPDEAERRGVVMALKSLEESAQKLDDPAVKTTHPIIGEKLKDFERDVKAARLAAELSPPNLYLAGRVVGSCNACHRVGFAGTVDEPVVPEEADTDDIPAAGRPLLAERMERHGLQMSELLWSVLFLSREEVAQIAEEITDEPRIARPLPGHPSDLNNRFPKEFFELQDDLHIRAGVLKTAAEGGDDAAIGKAFGHMVETCVKCHSKYLEPVD